MKATVSDLMKSQRKEISSAQLDLPLLVNDKILSHRFKQSSCFVFKEYLEKIIKRLCTTVSY